MKISLRTKYWESEENFKSKTYDMYTSYNIYLIFCLIVSISAFIITKQTIALTMFTMILLLMPFIWMPIMSYKKYAKNKKQNENKPIDSQASQ